MESAFPRDSFRRPSGELSPASAEVISEGIKASLHREGDDVWLRVEHEETVLFEDVDGSALITARTRDRGPFVLVGSWAQLPRGVTRVRVKQGEEDVEPSASDDGWLCLLASSARGPVSVVWLDDEGHECESTDEGPPLEDSGTLGPTFYGPLIS